MDEGRPIEDTDVVLWYTLGSHYITRPEDWPVMSAERTGFMLRPAGFFDRDPALDVTPSPVRALLVPPRRDPGSRGSGPCLAACAVPGGQGRSRAEIPRAA